MKIATFYDHIEEAAKQRGLPLAEALRQVRQAGIEAVEIEAERLEAAWRRNALCDAGIGISCIYRFLDWGYSSDMRSGYELIDLAKENGAEKVMAIPGFWRAEDMTDVRKRMIAAERMQEALKRLCAYAAEQTPEIVVVLEDFDDRLAPYATMEQLEGFARKVDGLGVVLDTGNFIYSGEDVLAAYERLRPRIRHVHLKDRILRWGADSGLRAEAEAKAAQNGLMMYGAAVGAGELPIREVIAGLQRSGYDGVYAIEHFGMADQLGAIRRSAEWLRQTLEETRL